MAFVAKVAILSKSDQSSRDSTARIIDEVWQQKRELMAKASSKTLVYFILQYKKVENRHLLDVSKGP
jgi:hypothetical protein